MQVAAKWYPINPYVDKDHLSIPSLSDEVAAAAVDYLETVTRDYAYLLPRGWQCIAKLILFNEIGEDGKDGEELKLVLQADEGGGSFAEVKMNTLETFPGKLATGTDEIDFIRSLIEQADLQVTDVGAEICDLPDAQALVRRHHDWLKNTLNYTNYYGAIRVPFSTIMPLRHSFINHEIRISFSGASQEQDVMFATFVLKAIQRRMVEVMCKYHFTFQLDSLKEIPNIRFWLDSLDIRESMTA